MQNCKIKDSTLTLTVNTIHEKKYIKTLRKVVNFKEYLKDKLNIPTKVQITKLQTGVVTIVKTYKSGKITINCKSIN